MNVFLIITAAILIVCTLIGVKRGFVHTVFTMFSLLIVILITGLLSPYVADYINGHTQIPAKINRKVEEEINLKEKINKNGGNLIETIDKMEISEQIKDLIKDKGEDAGGSSKEKTSDEIDKLADSVNRRITDLIVSAIAYLFTFAVVLVIVIVAGLLLDIVAKLPGIKQANEILGAVVGLLQGYMIVSVLYVAAMAFAATDLGSAVIRMVGESPILTWFFDHNILVDIMFGMIR